MSTSDEDEATYGGTNVREREAASPYPVSRLAPSFRLVDLARQLEDADRVIVSVAHARHEEGGGEGGEGLLEADKAEPEVAKRGKEKAE